MNLSNNNTRLLLWQFNKSALSLVKSFCLGIMCLYVQSVNAEIKEYDVQLEAEGEIYTIPVEVEAETTENITPIGIEQFYIKVDGVDVQLEPIIAAKLYAMSHALTHIASYDYFEVSEEMSFLFIQASSLIDDMTVELSNAANAAAVASFVSGTATGWAIGGKLCLAGIVTVIGSVKGCAAGIATGTFFTVESIFDAASTAVSEGKKNVIKIAEPKIYLSGGRYALNQGFKKMIDVEYFANKISSASGDVITFSQVIDNYRKLYLGAANYEDARLMFEKVGLIDLGSTAKRIAGAWGVGGIPFGSTASLAFQTMFGNDDTHEEATNAVINIINTNQARNANLDEFLIKKQSQYIAFFENKWEKVPESLPNIELVLTTESTESLGEIKFIAWVSGLTVSEIKSYSFNFGDGYSYRSESNSPYIANPSIRYQYNQSGTYIVSATVVAYDGRQKTVEHTIQIDQAVDRRSVNLSNLQGNPYPDDESKAIISGSVRDENGNSVHDGYVYFTIANQEYTADIINGSFVKSSISPEDNEVITVTAVDSRGISASGLFTFKVPETNNYSAPVNPYLDMSSPNGGELWRLGTPHTIQWSTNTTNSDDTFLLELFKNNSFYRKIGIRGANKREKYWLIPADIPSGSDYMVRISSESDPSQEDYSERFFSLTDTNIPPVIFPKNIQVVAGETVSDTVEAFDVNQDILTFSISRQPTKGVVTIDEFGEFKYSALTGTEGFDSFEISAIDGEISMPATITVKVRSVESSSDYLFNTALSGHIGRIEGVVIKNGKIYSGSLDDHIKVWDIISGDQLDDIDAGASILSLDIAGDLAVVGTTSDDVRVFNLTTGQQVGKTMEGHVSNVDAVVVGDGIIYSAAGVEIKKWNLNTASFAGNFKYDDSDRNNHDLDINALFYKKIPDIPAILYSASDDEDILSWEEDAYRSARYSHIQDVTALFVTSEYVVIGDKRGGIRIWSISGTEKYYISNAHVDDVTGIWVAGNEIITSSYDKSIKIWNLETGQLKQSIDNAHDAQIYSLGYDNGVIVSGDLNGVIKTWKRNDQDTALIGFNNNELTLEYDKDIQALYIPLKREMELAGEASVKYDIWLEPSIGAREFIKSGVVVFNDGEFLKSIKINEEIEPWLSNTTTIFIALSESYNSDLDVFSEIKLSINLKAKQKWLDFTNELTVNKTGSALDRVNRLLYSFVNISNSCEADIHGPIRMVVSNSTIPLVFHESVGLTPDGVTEEGEEYFTILSEGESLKPGESLGNLRLNFELQRAALSYDVKIVGMEGIFGCQDNLGWTHFRANLEQTGAINLVNNPHSGSYSSGSTIDSSNGLLNDFIETRTGDVDGDGKFDLVIINGTKLFIRYGDKSKSDATNNIPVLGYGPILEDVNSDGILDIIVGSRSNMNYQLNIYTGDGSHYQTVYGRKGQSWDSQHLHLLPTHYLGNGKVAVTYSAGYSLDPRGYAVLDMQKSSVFSPNIGQESWHYDVGPITQQTATADIDGDGKLEFLARVFTPHNGATGTSGTPTDDYTLATIVVSEDGQEFWTKTLGSDTSGGAKGGNWVALTDLENDGSYEIVTTVGHYSPYYPGDAQIRILDALTGTLKHKVSTGYSTNPMMFVADIDQDGIKEIISSSTVSNTISIYNNNLTTYTLSTGELARKSITGTIKSIADIDGDGDIEIILADGVTIKAIQAKDLTEEWQWTAPNGSNIYDAIPSDIDGDGLTDIIVSQQGIVTILQ